MDTVLVVALINLLIDWLGKQPVAPGGPTQEQLNETDKKWAEAKAKWTSNG